MNIINYIKNDMSKKSKAAIIVIIIVILSFILENKMGWFKNSKDIKGNYDPSELIEGRKASDLERLSKEDLIRLDELTKKEVSEKPLIIASYKDIENEKIKEVFLQGKLKHADLVDIILLSTKELKSIDETTLENQPIIRVYTQKNNLPNYNLGKYADIGFFILTDDDGNDVALQTDKFINGKELDTIVETIVKDPS